MENPCCVSLMGSVVTEVIGPHDGFGHHPAPLGSRRKSARKRAGAVGDVSLRLGATKNTRIRPRRAGNSLPREWGDVVAGVDLGDQHSKAADLTAGLGAPVLNNVGRVASAGLLASRL
jgi:hypothetical protein